MIRLKLLAAAAMLCQASLFAQADKATLQKHWQKSKAFTLAVAEAMPADGYNFKATEAEMSFGELMNHIAGGNGNYCAAASGGKSVIEKSTSKTISKEEAIKNLNAAYDACESFLNSATPEQMSKMVEARKATASELLWGGFTHAAHHRAQAEVYLRLKGIEPPKYQF